MRIVGGLYKGRRINAPKGMETRPTTDRTRESLFNILTHKIDFQNLYVLDLFAGSGALGLEAMSRGAAFCLFVDQDAKARATIRDNTEMLDLFGQTKILRRSATHLGLRPPAFPTPFRLAFLDAPYDQGLTAPALNGLVQMNWLDPNALLVVEQSAREDILEIEGLTLNDDRKFGDSAIRFYQLSSQKSAP